MQWANAHNLIDSIGLRQAHRPDGNINLSPITNDDLHSSFVCAFYGMGLDFTSIIRLSE